MEMQLPTLSQRTGQRLVIIIKLGDSLTLYCTVGGTLGWIVSLIQIGIWLYWILNRLGIL